ncbi:phosphoethanolamine transferase [Enterobacter sp. Bisph1]|uniref:phosphoethanolamine transferase n=1 Tax=Enterobacter sp. Bisph1 TaxID=1274399 RepID=UPI000691129A|nr:phosphoethanolamine transferase [Enterobacter sp. Bisph1]
MQITLSYFKPNSAAGLKNLINRENLCLVVWVLLAHYALGYQYKLIYVFSALAGFLLLRSITKIGYRFLVAVYMLAGALYAPVGINYGFPDINVIGSLMYTNPNEANEFLANIPAAAWLLSVSIIVFGIATLVASFSKHKNAPVTRGVYSFLMVFFVASAFWSAVRQGQLLSTGLPEIRFVHDIYTAYQAVRDNNQNFARIMTTGNIWNPVSLPGQRKTYILVVGESVRRDYLHTFGGKYTNTPWLDSTPSTQFTQYISAGPSTVISLTNTLARRNENAAELNNNIVALASRAGFETWWISNQGKKGHFDSPVALIGESADHHYFTKADNSDDRLYAPDEELLPELDKALKQGNGKKFIVLHLMGSHPKACVRTHDLYDIDVGAKEISCYIKSIAMTDKLLGQIHEMAEREGGDWSMMYFSDHGLSYINKDTSGAYLTHGDKTRENYEVPFIVVDKNQKDNVIIPVQRSGLRFIETFAQWLKIRDPQIDQSCDMFSGENCSLVNQVLNFQGQLSSFEALSSVK